MQVKLNDKKIQTEAKTLLELLGSIDTLPSAYAVAINGKIIPKSSHVTTALHEDDDIEVFALMAGG